MTTPLKLYKIATTEEKDHFINKGKIESSLDEADGFVHMSDASMCKKVADMFFKDMDVWVLEFDLGKLCKGTSKVVVGKMGDGKPIDIPGVDQIVLYLLPDGCIHVYGEPVSIESIVREGPVPVTADGGHAFPDWL